MDENRPLDGQLIPVIGMLVDDAKAKSVLFQEASTRLNTASTLAVIAAGLDPKEFQINWDLKAFTLRKKE